MIRLTFLILLGGLSACGPSVTEPVARMLGPLNAAPGSCHAKGITPAILETVTQQVQEASEVRDAYGSVIEPARFRTSTSTRIVRERGEHWFETPCALRRGDPEFVQQVQRALAARGFYAGEVHGLYDVPTRAAVRAFQDLRGLESGTLSMESAQALGLIELGRSSF
ncbi:Putative peptidoglycan binding domain-containing protein [Jannaschia faecimaris]|uniref:Putative peptidoglycan binding domain-containing protein n=1 Tax=Jannaschia faecimaris TaxID=1244108 RepID=A0A1H3N645_9RHOB|nr:peptidoglycan-binding domain-containing protein [Jannaschia faecimaris]SDY83689.1 Putative peptidoglycan binding domain-containing protein [Jannaschia faecimaris]